MAHAQDVDVPEDTELSFMVVVAVSTLFCCVATCCTAICIKVVMFVFGHRGTRRLVRRPRFDSSTQITGDPGNPVAACPSTFVSVQDARSSEGIRGSEIELRTVDVAKIKGDGSDADTEWEGCGDKGTDGEHARSSASSSATAPGEGDESVVRAMDEADWNTPGETMQSAVEGSSDRRDSDEEQGLYRRGGPGG